MPAKVNRRSAVLWACAIFLGGAAGLNWKRMSTNERDNQLSALVANGFQNKEDAALVADLIERETITSISDEQVKVIVKYSKGDSLPSSMVIGVISSAGTQDVAEKFAPILKRLTAEQPEREFLTKIPSIWKSRGINVGELGL